MSYGEHIWDKSASAYLRFENKWHYYLRIAEGLLRPLQIDCDSRVLELAGGTGACTLLLSEICAGGQVVCVERSRAMLKLARRSLRRTGRSNVIFAEGDVSGLPELVEGMGKFDSIVCNAAFWQFSEKERLLAALRSLLTPRGFLAFNLPLWGGRDRDLAARRRIMTRIMVAHGIDPKKLFGTTTNVSYEELLGRAGFEVTRDSRYSVVMLPEERKEWRRIPAFSRRWGQLGGVPPDVAAEMRRELAKSKVPLWPENKARRNMWRSIVASPVFPAKRPTK
jgi:ubiquinone/menaquinone biosynthesis C-methylase UbiE